MSQAPDRVPIKIDIAVCTYRRIELDKTLRSLAELMVPAGSQIRIIVADNDVAPSAKGRVDAMRSAVPFDITYVHCPASNISIARNACLDHATGDFLAFIDDDETASKGWLAELLSSAEVTGADAVLGPARAIYLDTAPSWMKKGDFHSTLPVWVRGRIDTGYTCNVLLRRRATSLTNGRFNLALGRTGGEDTEFFADMTRGGGAIAFAPQAWVDDPVPENRASLSWLAKRRFRFGQTHGRLLLENSGGTGLIRKLAVAGAKAVYCFAAAGLTSFMPISRYRFMLRGILHAGVVSGLLGVREIEQYGTLESTSR
jgi:succinoglycan biosynthesis protein ExoM